MKAKFIFIAFIGFLIASICSCTKAGTGGKATVICKIINNVNSDTLSDLTVYIKYGQKTAPSSNTSGYDDHKEAAPRSNTVTFTGLNQGDYYFYVTGKDSLFPPNNTPVKGGGVCTILHSQRNSSNTFTVSVSN
ncbi:MAG TPA: hypothetical protein VK835_00010 [Bacteroidia bacterium]|jgi:hypothetical protein|nr:hypothetical protein [Bacteroidia bacterium]